MTRSFGRLKSQRVRDLFRRSERKKQESNDPDHKDQNIDDAPLQLSVSYFCILFGLANWRFDIDSKFNKSQETGDMKQNIMTRDPIKYPQKASRHEIKQFPVYQREETKYRVSDIGSGGSDVSRASSNSFRGWGNREPMNDYSSRTDDISPRRRNLSDKNSFFSRKSFKDLGCSEYMIDSLRGLNFIRPSHIQVYECFTFQIISTLEIKDIVISDFSISFFA